MSFAELFDDYAQLSAQVDIKVATAGIPAGSGVVLFVSEAGYPILLLYGADLRRLVRHRLGQIEPEKEVKSRRIKLRQVAKGLWYRRCWSAFETQLHYFQIARAVYPQSYRELFPHLQCWFIALEEKRGWPFFTRTQKTAGGTGRIWGPFADGPSAANFLERLEDVFDLCRHPEKLSREGASRTCPYVQMNRCPAVCQGRASREEYNAGISRAAAFLDNMTPDITIALREQMQRWAGELNFEQAQREKVKIDQVKKMLAPSYRWVMPLARFRVLSLQSGPPVKTAGRRAGQMSVIPFIITAQSIAQLPAFSMNDLADGALAAAVLKCSPPGPAEPADRKAGDNQEDFLAWAARLLYKKSPDKGLYLPALATIAADDLTTRIMQHFTRSISSKNRRPKLDSDSLLDNEG